MTDERESPAASDDSDDADETDGADDSLEDRVDRLHRHLEATAELPIERRANRWLGEAEAVARDLATSDLDRETVEVRVAKIGRLLSEVDDTGDEDGDAHLEAARRECDAILES